MSRSQRTALLVAGIAALGGCGQEVWLGDQSTDIAALYGDYNLDHLSLRDEPFCEGVLAGRESELMGLSPESLGLRDGDVLLDVGDSTRMIACGLAIEEGYYVAEVPLYCRHPVPAPGLCLYGAVDRSAAGPLGTVAVSASLSLSEESGVVDGLIGESSIELALYEADGGGGRCQLTVTALLTRY
jgi:hypothetical protein